MEKTKSEGSASNARRTLLRRVIAAAIVVAAFATSAAGAVQAGTVQPGETISRFFPEASVVVFPAADGADCRGVVYIPAGKGPHPLVITLNGGSSESSDALGVFRRFAAAFAQAGYAVLSPDYRTGALGGPSLDDVFGALDFAAGHPRLDRNRVIIVGESEGAYLAMLTAEKTSVAGVICLGGFYDLIPVMNDFGHSRKAARKTLADMTAAELGDPVPESDAYLARSPVHNAAGFAGRALLFHSKDDTVIGWRYSQNMAEALLNAGKNVDFYVLDGSTRKLDFGDPEIVKRMWTFLGGMGLPVASAENDQGSGPS